MRRQTRGRRKGTKRQTRKLYRQRGGAIVGLLPALSKLRFIMTLYADNANVTAFLDRLLKVLEMTVRILPRTFPELEAHYRTIPAWDQMRVPGAVGDTTVARQDALRAKMLKYELSRIPVAPGQLPITIHNDAQNDFGFEQNVNNIITASTQLFDTLVKTVDAAGAVNDPASRRAAFFEKFNVVIWVCVDGTVSDILEFISNSEFMIIRSQSFLLNVGRRINRLLDTICSERKYFKLERVYFLNLLQDDLDLRFYIQDYRDGIGGVREKAAQNMPVGLPDVGESTTSIIEAIFDHMIAADAVTILTIGTTEFVQACVGAEVQAAGAALAAAAVAAPGNPAALVAAGEAAEARVQAAFEAKLRSRPQRVTRADIENGIHIIMKLLQVYNRTTVDSNRQMGASQVTITAVDPPTYTYTQNGEAQVDLVLDINYIDFSYVAAPVPA